MLMDMEIDTAMALAFATIASATGRNERRTKALIDILARQQICAAGMLNVAPLPMRAGSVGTLATNGTEIIYSERFLFGVLRRLCDAPDCAAGAVLGMIAHELAHAYQHRGLDAHPHRLELEADWIAGWVLGRAGVCPQHFLRVLGELAETATHPHPRYRSDVVSRGFASGTAARVVDAACRRAGG